MKLCWHPVLGVLTACTALHLPNCYAVRSSPAGMSSAFGNCGTVLRFYWFAFAFVTLTLISILVALASRWGLHYARPFVSNLVAICVVLMMIASEAFLGYETVYNSFNLDYLWWQMRFRAACAGAIMTVVLLIFLLMAVGIE